MFGYVTVQSATLSLEEKACYRSYYCGVCQQLRQRFGATGQLTLSYDTTFLALLLADLYDEPAGDAAGRCLHNLGRRVDWALNESTGYAADMNLILAYFQCLDHVRDEGNLAYQLAAQRLQKPAQAAGKRWPRQYAAVEQAVAELARLEAANQRDLDTLAAPTGQILAEIFVRQEDAWAATLRGCGFYLGKFIYLMDAWEDAERDAKRGCFNPLAAERQREDFDGWCYELLREMMGQSALYFERLPLVEHASLLRNILYTGVWTRYALLHAKREKKRTP